MAGNVATLTDANWDAEVMASPQPVLVDFWGEWCQPCKKLVPVLEDLASTYAGKLRVGKIDAGENDDVPLRYNVSVLPTLLLIKKGMVVEQHVGVLSKEALAKLVEPHLG